MRNEGEKHIIELYRAFHQMPEYGLRLPMTKKLISDELDAMGIAYSCCRESDSVIAEIKGAYDGNCVAFRADMDALHVQEDTGLSYASKIEGCMHACGHDAHTAMALEAARLLLERQKELHGSVRLLFEAGEEVGQGALKLLEENAMDGVDALFGLHIGTIAGAEIPSGTFVAIPGAVTAGKDTFSIEIHGKGGHGAYPSEAIDPIRIAAQVIIAVQSIVSMEIPSGKGAVITFGSICGGMDNNSIPDRVTISGTVRTQSEDVRQYIGRRIKEIVSTIPTAFGGYGKCAIARGSSPVINDARLSSLAADTIANLFGEENVIRVLPKALMGSDDFSRLAAISPCLYFFLSSSDPKKHTDMPHHNARFAVDESVLYTGAKAVAAVLEEYLSR